MAGALSYDNEAPGMNAPVKTSIAAILPELAEWRRDFHRHPELQYELPRTAALVAERLRGFGFDEVHERIGKSGVVGLLHGASGPATGKDERVLLRADMDALPIREVEGRAYGSQTAGRMHACGHDGHTTLLLGAARHLAETRDFSGTLVFCFQPAEEGGAGAKAMIDDGLFQRFPVKGVYGLHNWPGMAIGHFGVVRGAAMASADRFDIVVKGVGGHAAMPDRTRDPIVAASALVMALQTIVSRRIDPLQPAVVSVSAFHAGEAYNVIPTEARLRLGFRAFSQDTASAIEAELRQICAGVALTYGVEIDIVRPDTTPYPPTINHPEETEIALAAMRAVTGVDNVRDDLAPVTGSEDFSFMLREVPGAYVFLGNGASAPLHHPAYDFNDAALSVGVAYWCELARRVLPPA